MKLVFGLAASSISIQAKNPPSRAMALNRIPLVVKGRVIHLEKCPKPDEKHQMGIEPTPLDWKADVLPLNYWCIYKTLRPKISVYSRLVSFHNHRTVMN